MIALAPTPAPAEHLVLYDVSWEAYESLLAAFGDRRLRHAYDEGVLEIMSPLRSHDGYKKLLARLIETAALEWDIDIESMGSTTLRKRPKAKGLEPDECYYVEHAEQMRHYDDYDPSRDPPPDLAIEVDVTHSSVDRMAVYAGLGVPEVWRLHDGKLLFCRLTRKKYVPLKSSLAFPGLTAKVVERFLGMRGAHRENAIVRDFIAWLQEHPPKK